MSEKSPPLAIRLIGFSSKEEASFTSVLSLARDKAYRYVCIKSGNLLEPNAYIVNVENIKALATLAALNPGSAHPVLLIGKTDISLPHTLLPRPIRWRDVFTALDMLAEKRELVLNSLSAFETVAVMERRRSARLDLDLTDPEVYIKMRRAKNEPKSILIIDRDSNFREYVAGIMSRYQIPVAVTSQTEVAFDYDREQDFPLVMINTTTQDVDPYELCRVLKAQAKRPHKDVIFLVGKPFVYDDEAAQAVGCDGFLDKPVARRQLLLTLQKFLNLH